MKIELKILEHAKEFYDRDTDSHKHLYKQNLPEYATEGSAAMDLISVEDVILYPGETCKIKTGIAIWISSAFPYGGMTNNVVGLIVPRSGLGTKGLVLANTIGIIDEDYQGELLISALNRNLNDSAFFDESSGEGDDFNKIEIKAGDRIAQLLLIPVVKASWTIVDEFSDKTDRGEGGFSSTGV